ncbi:hypothetical protein, variant [Aphanomyces invadans]|uniref:Uncharacterized protein n=1 Tax=Aphanomyces invadans TaxID=157072 RepID=A0A024TY94_9STRA|nr:hypothetical protein, variant [Aphanomyces invadans]ETV98939.1 hypothetical protein, variant [Aphanomyces invadans]|eukprot:XP_008872366.1 hypothetical protein, variant [Aphanomyces invadans]
MTEFLHLASQEQWTTLEQCLDGYNGDLLMEDEEGDTVFIMACCAGTLRLISLLLEHRQAESFVNKTNQNGFSGFIYACIRGDGDIVALLLNTPFVQVNLADNDSMTALMYACGSRDEGLPKIVAMLLQDPRVDVHAVDLADCTAFSHALDLNHADKEGMTGFMYACEDSNARLMQLLMNHPGVNVNATNQVGMSGFLMVCRNGDFTLIRDMMEHPKLKVNQENNDGWTAADFISCKLHCATHANDVPDENDAIVDSIGRILRRGGSMKHQMMTVACKGECKGSIMNLSEWAHDRKWDEIESQLRAGYLGDINKTFRGTALLERCCNAGKHDLVELILQHKGIDVDALNNNRNSALDVAMSRNREECVKLLLAAGAEIEHGPKQQPGATRARKLSKDGDRSPTKGNDAIRTLVENEVRKRAEFPLHCWLEYRKLDKFHDALQTVTVSLDLTDQNGKTVLMMAAEAGWVDIVRVLLQRGAEIDFQQPEVEPDLPTLLGDGIKGKTALVFAGLNGHCAVVDVLLSHLADMDIMYMNEADKLEYSIRDLIQDKLDATNTVDSSLVKCLELLEKEAVYRASSSVYVEKLRSKLQAMADDAPFDESLFRRAINTDPSLGRLFLNDCLHPDRHELGFSKLEIVYGVNNVHTSALYSILRLDSPNSDYMFRAKKLLEHVVMQRVLHLKWEFFAQRMFIEQLLIYIVLIASMTISVTLHGSSPTNELVPMEVAVWLTVIVFACLGFSVAQMLHPKPLWRFARCLYDGQVQFDPRLNIPNLALLKLRAKWIMAGVVVVGTPALTAPMVLWVLPRVASVAGDAFTLGAKIAINIVLWITTGYFLVLEWKEFRGESGLTWVYRWFGGTKSTSDYDDLPTSVASIESYSSAMTAKTSWKYFESAVNRWQIVAYAVVLGVYVPYELGASMFIPEHAMLCIGCTLTLVLWILSLQYFAVFRTGGYLLPMMSGILQDVWNFLSIFMVVQCAITCAFYQLFHGYDDSGYETLWQAFTTTFFVLFGQFNTNMWTHDPLVPAMADPVVNAFSMALLLFHATTVSVLLVNVLLATMNRTVDRGLDLSKTEALWSYAECILRMEVTFTSHQRDRVIFLDTSGPPQTMGRRHITVWRQSTTHSSLDESAPLVAKLSRRGVSSFRQRAEVIGVLNPAFDETVPKAALSIGEEDAQVIKGLEETIKDWDTALDELHTTTIGELEKVRTSIKHTNHFTKTAMFTEELEYLTRTKRKIADIFADATKKRAPESMDKAKRIHELDKRVQHEMADLVNQHAKVVQNVSSVMFYQIVHGIKLTDAVARCVRTIQTSFVAVKDKFTREAMEEPTLSDVQRSTEARLDTIIHSVRSHSLVLKSVADKVDGGSVDAKLMAMRDELASMKAEMNAQQAKMQLQLDLIVRLLSESSRAAIE